MIFLVFFFFSCCTGKFHGGSQVRSKIGETTRKRIHEEVVHASRDTLKKGGDWEEKDKERKRIRVGTIELGTWTQKRLRHVERDCHTMNMMNCDMRYDTMIQLCCLGSGHVRHCTKEMRIRLSDHGKG